MSDTPYLTLDEIFSVLEELHDNDEGLQSVYVVVLPPSNVEYVTDEENINDDNIEEAQVVEVAVATSFDHVEHMSSVLLYNKDQKKKCPVPIPKVIKNYSNSMGGVDLQDWEPPHTTDIRAALQGRTIFLRSEDEGRQD
ncbi:hypothetical protein J6590_029882 [Homalodisca vitripennis]|nr:hypothetical protein J6590_029882 [Homalodisca vitripennis]